MAEETVASVLSAIRFGADGLVPVIVQDAATGQVRMVGYANAEAVRRTLETGRVHFWSRSRQRLWMKGETSGHVLELVELRVDCDGDALLARVRPHGPTCHTGKTSCFDTEPLARLEAAPESAAIVDEVARVIAARAADPQPGSYTSALLAAGVDRIARKIGEEAAEVIVAAKNGEPEPLAREAADLLYHLLVLLQACGVPVEQVWQVLRERRGHSSP
ncbi:bifunctional phosphoribosyl-AMP cyclohydrolase/phosphoribosyl-ATP diphosphatase HisIE [Thermomicrobium sp. 4228-Ro]|uniref:bifunctional phosphoribosyl-AMP cyclohydrolase/phosphoribosyl-ATP diphosphatase HisIE n=1 Tax=Thermomicrobium sp. 4228-Ro TaxID=2993937 RepID=UPI0022495AFA|nr:bifunctional phosphoribosyl-AMP cyclohydrolase/phosphoribosyl-ATP diphosphatase HisIE [Thermomicrobium sp. 4228-Ro]MCX2726732.1 bifunctional phosphoribosyl-AMP cyclohydrolase/phosphoribosyl-ATP diphosphatase HisIE [Thermomicrobium sp. 4228-Ro]